MQALFQESQDFDFTSLLSQIEDGKNQPALSETILNDIEKDPEMFALSPEGADERDVKLSYSVESSPGLPTPGSKSSVPLPKMPSFDKLTPPAPGSVPPPSNYKYAFDHDESLTTADFLRAQSSMKGVDPYGLDVKLPKHGFPGGPSSMHGGLQNKKRARKSDRTPEEKIQSKRERNRQHARNTRVRKKAYIENLKRTVDTFLKAKVAQEAEQKLESDRRTHRKLQRYKILSYFMNYRSTGVVDASKWNTILEPGFSCVLPVSPYRSYPKSEIQGNRRTILGTKGMQIEAQSMQLFLESIGKGSENWQRTFNLPAHERSKWTTKFLCSIPSESFISQDNDVVVAKWSFKTVNAVVNGSNSEIEIEGMAYCSFSMYNKLQKVELCFDVLGTIQSLKDALGARLMNTIPQTIEKAKKEVREPTFICETQAPFKLVHANERWGELLGVADPGAAVGRPLEAFQGPKEKADPLGAALRAVAHGQQPGSAVVPLRKQGGKGGGAPFKAYVRLYPLGSAEAPVGAGAGRPAYVLGYVEPVPDLPPSSYHAGPPPVLAPMPPLAAAPPPPAAGAGGAPPGGPSRAHARPGAPPAFPRPPAGLGGPPPLAYSGGPPPPPLGPGGAHLPPPSSLRAALPPGGPPPMPPGRAPPPLAGAAGGAPPKRHAGGPPPFPPARAGGAPPLRPPLDYRGPPLPRGSSGPPKPGGPPRGPPLPGTVPI